MLVLPNMDPSLHTSRSPSLSRTCLRHITTATARLSLLLCKIVGTAIAMLLIPRTIHMTVHCFDDLYEILGRRARSPWETQGFSGHGALVGLAIMIILHHLLFRIGCNVVLNEDLETERARRDTDGVGRWKYRKVTWERVLVRMIIPAFLYGGLCVMGWKVWTMGGDARDVVKANTVDLADDRGAGLMWRDR